MVHSLRFLQESGVVESFDVQDDSTVLVGFKTRAAAEQVVLIFFLMNPKSLSTP